MDGLLVSRYHVLLRKVKPCKEKYSPDFVTIYTHGESLVNLVCVCVCVAFVSATLCWWCHYTWKTPHQKKWQLFMVESSSCILSTMDPALGRRSCIGYIQDGVFLADSALGLPSRAKLLFPRTKRPENLDISSPVPQKPSYRQTNRPLRLSEHFFTKTTLPSVPSFASLREEKYSKHNASPVT